MSENTEPTLRDPAASAKPPAPHTEERRKFDIGREWAERAYVGTASELARVWPDAPREVVEAYASSRAFDLSTIRGLASRLAGLYLEETGLTADQALRAYRLQTFDDDTLEARDALPDDVRAEYDRSSDIARSLQRAALLLAPSKEHLELGADLSDFAERYPEAFTPETISLLRVAAEAAAAGTALDYYQFLASPPGAAELWARGAELLRPYRLTEQDRALVEAETLGGAPPLHDWLKPGGKLSEAVLGFVAQALETHLESPDGERLRELQTRLEATGLLKQGKRALEAQFVDRRKVDELYRSGKISLEVAREYEERGRRLGIWEQQALHGLLNLADADGRFDGVPAAQAERSARQLLRASRGNLDFAVSVRIPAYGETSIADRLGYERGDDGRARTYARNSLRRAVEDLKVPRWLAVRSLRFDTKARQYRDEWLLEKAPILTEVITETGEKFYRVHASVFQGQLKDFLLIPAPGIRYEKALQAIGAKRLRDEFARLQEYCRYLAQAQSAENARKFKSADEPPRLPAEPYQRPLKESTLLVRGCGWAAEDIAKRGAPYYRRKLEQALEFVVHLDDVLASWSVEQRDDGPFYTLGLRDVGAVLEPDQYTFLGGEGGTA